MPSLFKDGPQLLAQGIDLARRRNFGEAAGAFADAARKFQKSGDAQSATLALAYGQLMHCPPGATAPGTLRSLADLLDSLGSAQLQPGARAIEANRLSGQLRLAATEFELWSAANAGVLTGGDLAQRYQGLAQSYMSLGQEPLFLEELFEGRTVPGSSRFAKYSAMAEEALGGSLQAANPAEAAQHFQAANLWWQQAGDVGRAGGAANQVALLSTRASCWFCGRDGSGLGVQLVTLPVDVPVKGLTASERGPLPSVDPSGNQVYACAGCYSSVRLLADSIAVRHDMELAARIQVQLDEIKRQLAAVRHT